MLVARLPGERAHHTRRRDATNSVYISVSNVQYAISIDCNSRRRSESCSSSRPINAQCNGVALSYGCYSSAVGHTLSQGFEREKQERQQAEAFHNDGGKNLTAQA